MQTKWYLHGPTHIYSANDVNIIVPMKAVVLLDALKNRETKFCVLFACERYKFAYSKMSSRLGHYKMFRVRTALGQN